MHDDYEHFSYINKIFEQTFGIKLNIREWVSRNTILATIGSKAIATFFKHIGFPIGNKSDNGYVPQIIMESSQECKQAFLRGLADTDFSLTFKQRKKTGHSYPVLKGDFKSKRIVYDSAKLIKDMGIHCTIGQENPYDKRINRHYEKHVVYIRGHKYLEKWMNLVGFNNTKHQTRYLIWKKHGFCPPYTNLKERKAILDNKMALEGFEFVSQG